LSDVATQTVPPAVRNAPATGQRTVAVETDSVAGSPTQINHADKLTYDTYSQTDRTANETVRVDYLVVNNDVQIHFPRTAAGDWSAAIGNVVQAPENLSNRRRKVTIRLDSGEVDTSPCKRTRWRSRRSPPGRDGRGKTVAVQTEANRGAHSGTISGYTRGPDDVRDVYSFSSRSEGALVVNQGYVVGRQSCNNKFGPGGGKSTSRTRPNLKTEKGRISSCES